MSYRDSLIRNFDEFKSKVSVLGRVINPNGMARTGRQMLNCDEPDTIDESQTRRFAQTKSSDELGALEEARRSVEQIAIPERRPVNRLTYSAFV